MSIGAAIALARQEASLSLADVSERTRIRASVIEAIEADDFSHCGGDVYARGHLRAIASAVGADPRPWVEEYDQTFGTPAPSATEVLETELVAPGRRRGTNWSALMAVALVLAVGLVGYQLVSASDDPARTPVTVGDPSPTVTATEPSDDAEPSEEPTQVAQAENDEVVLRIVALPDGISWVRVTDPDDQVVYEGTLSEGQSKTVRDSKYLRVVLGNAAGVELTVNGQDLGSPGGPGEVANLKFTPRDPAGAAG